MTTRYVSHLGSNTSPYDTMAKAATAFGTAVTASIASDVILVASDHSETSGAATYTFPTGRDNPVEVVSVDRTTEAPETMSTGGGSITTGNTGAYADYVFNGCVAMYGMKFVVEDDFRWHNVSECDQQYDSCVFALSANEAPNPQFVFGNNQNYVNNTLRFVNCTFDKSSTTYTSGGFIEGLGEGAITKFIGCSFSKGGDTAFIRNEGALQPGYIIEVTDSDISDFTTLMDSAVQDRNYVIIRRCKIHASFSICAASLYIDQERYVSVEQCDDGTITVPPLGLHEKGMRYGATKSTLSRYRTGGADDGEQANEYAWDMTTTANAKELYQFIESPPMVRWVESGSQTLTIHIAGGATLNDDDFWVHVSSPSEEGSATATGKFNETRMVPQATPAALTTDSGATWNGTGVGTKQKIDVSINPTIPGTVTVRCFLAKPSTTVYVDPKIEVA